MPTRTVKWMSMEVPKNLAGPATAFIHDGDARPDTVALDVPDLSSLLNARARAIFLLHTAAEIEHALLVQYLYAAFSLGPPSRGAEIPGDAEAQVNEWRNVLLKTAREEMGHLMTVQNLLRLIGGPLNFEREDFPFNKELYPFHFTLEPLSKRSLAKYIAAEMPAQAAEDQDLQPIIDLAREAAGGMPVNRVGVLYGLLFSIFSEPEDTVARAGSNIPWDAWVNLVQMATNVSSGNDDMHLGDEDIHSDTAPYQASWEDWGGEKDIIIRRVTNRREALAAIREIAQQGEGLQDTADNSDSHFARFLHIYRDFPDENRWVPTRDVPINPKVREVAALGSEDIVNERSRLWARLFNLRYHLLLHSLSHFLYNAEPIFVIAGERIGDRTGGGILQLWAFNEMRRMGKIADKLATLPCGRPRDSARAGAPFELPNTLILPDEEAARWALHLEILRASVNLVEQIRSSDPVDQNDPFLKSLFESDIESCAMAEALMAGEPMPLQATGYRKMLRILDEAVHGFTIRGEHGSFWVGQDLRQLATRSYYHVPFIVPGDGARSGIYRALEGLAPFGSDTGAQDAIWPRMPAGRPPVASSRREFIKQWIDSLPASGELPDEKGIQAEPNPSAEPIPTPTIDGGDVVIVGGGLAGLSAAAELCAKGLKVTILEKANQVGGKAMAWRDADKDTVEHGMHGWWHQYYNYFDLMRRVGIDPDDVLIEPMPATVVFEDGARREMELVKRRYPTPIYLLKYILNLGRLSIVDLLSGALPMGRMFTYEHGRDFLTYDGISIYEYLRAHGGSRALHELVISPFARSFAFSSTDKLSASAVISGLSFYFIGHQEDVLTRWCRGNPQELIIDCIANFITSHGGLIRTNATATGIEVDEGDAARINAVTVGEARREFRVPLSEIPADEPLVRDIEPGLRLLLRKVGNQVNAMRATCTHAGGIVNYLPNLRCYECPRHQGRFDLDGVVLAPPPARPLERLPTRIEGQEVVVGVGGRSVRFTSKFFILAPGVEGAKRIISSSPAVLSHETFRQILNLEATEVIVARLWLDKKAPEGLTSGVFAGLGILDNFFVLSNFQQEFRSYDGTVIEIQLYIVKDYIHLPDRELQVLIMQELGRLIPEFAGAKVRKWAVNRYWDLFTHYNVGSHHDRPTINSPYSNFFFAGDWIRLDQPWWMMEKAVTSGKIAANGVLEACGVEPVAVLLPSPDELFTRFSKRAWRTLAAMGRAIRRFLKYRPLPP